MESEIDPPVTAALNENEKKARNESSLARGNDEVSEEEVTNYLQGWPLHLVTTSLMLANFLPNVEATITATSLVSITSDLQGFDKSSWIITSYMLTYTGFLIIWAKLSDIFGRKSLLITSFTLFVVFSGGCAAAQNMTQLIILRAFQGVGAAGTYSLCSVIYFEMIPVEKYAIYSSVLVAILGGGLVLGPILGGVINHFTSWRWIFLFNVIVGAVTIVLIIITLPNNFPHHHLPESTYKPKTLRETFSRKQLKRVDFLGTTLLLAATLLIIAVLEETSIQYSWRSPFSIVVLICAILSWISFLIWSRKITLDNGTREPVFPWRFVQSPVCMGLLICVFLSGAPLTVAIVQIPLRFQLVNSMETLRASVRLLPFIIIVPLGAVSTSTAGKKIPLVYLFIGGSLVQVVGFTLLSTLPIKDDVTSAQYGYQVIAGFAVGICIASLTLMAPLAVEKKDKSVIVGAVLQFRLMGGAIGLAVVTTVMNSFIKSHLKNDLSPQQLRDLLATTSTLAKLPPNAIEAVRRTFAQGFNLQMRIMIGTSVAQVPLAFLMWKKDQIIV